ncbi:hypothetical protein HHE92_18590 [Pseudoalteromonas arctica]|nr:hypothetical protein [Pseudoalteromonas arctica]NMP81789.1 hypothetical protein [Pseudoalteromonas arctica]
MVNALDIGMKEFEYQLSINPNLNQDNFSLWKSKGAPILFGDNEYANDALEKAKNGNFSHIRGSAGNLRGLSRDVDNIGGFGEWWHEIDNKYWDTFYSTYMKTKKIGSNIDYTISGYWDNDEILDEEITGPMDKNELLNYLKPGESLDDLS